MIKVSPSIPKILGKLKDFPKKIEVWSVAEKKNSKFLGHLPFEQIFYRNIPLNAPDHRGHKFTINSLHACEAIFLSLSILRHDTYFSKASTRTLHDMQHRNRPDLCTSYPQSRTNDAPCLQVWDAYRILVFLKSIIDSLSNFNNSVGEEHECHETILK